MEIINWLNTNDGAVIGIATVVLVGITGYYAYLTRRLLKANDIPEIAISLCPHEAYLPCVMLCIENIGTGAARKLEFQTDLSFSADGETALEEVGFLRDGIDYLGPGQKIEHFLVSVLGKLDDLKKTPLEICVTYTDSVKSAYQRAFHLDFGEYEGYSRIGGSPLFEIAEATKDIQKDLHYLTTGIHKPIILTKPLSDHHLVEYATPLMRRMVRFSNEIQQEILQEMEVVISKREQEVHKKKQDEEQPTDQNSS